MARAGRPTKQESEDLSRRIVEVATRMFLEQGYADTTIDALATVLKASKRSIYARFANKADLFRAVTVSYAEQALHGIPPHFPADQLAEEQIYNACLDVLGLFLTADVIAIERVVVHEAGQFPEIVPIMEGARSSAMSHLHPGVAALGSWPVDDPRTRASAQMLWDLTVAAQVRGAALGLWPPAVTEQTRSETRKRIKLFLHGHAALVEQAHPDEHEESRAVR